jgi:hypothetical protein
VIGRLRSAAGQAAVEWLCIMAALVVLAGVLASTVSATPITSAFKHMICRVGVGVGACGADDDRPARPRQRGRPRGLLAPAAPIARAADVPSAGDADDDGLSDAGERRLGPTRTAPTPTATGSTTARRPAPTTPTRSSATPITTGSPTATRSARAAP